MNECYVRVPQDLLTPHFTEKMNIQIETRTRMFFTFQDTKQTTFTVVKSTQEFYIQQKFFKHSKKNSPVEERILGGEREEHLLIDRYSINSN